MTLDLILNGGKEMWELFKAMYIPMSEKQKEEYMQRIEDKKDFYQPQIEEKTGVSLGKVYVLPNMLWIKQELYNVYAKTCNPQINEQAKDMGPLQRQFVRATAPIIAAPLVALIGTPLVGFVKLQDQTIKLAAGDDSIRVPFGFDTRMSLWREKRRGSTDLDAAIVHELSHILWHRIEDKQKASKVYSRELNEGFATYCHEEYFRDIYPDNYILDMDMVGGIYKTGKNKIEKMIAKYGSEILLQIPSKWPELIKSMEWKQ